jgi:hypothetical protein
VSGQFTFTGTHRIGGWVDIRVSGDAVDYREVAPRFIDCPARSLLNIPNMLSRRNHMSFWRNVKKYLTHLTSRDKEPDFQRKKMGSSADRVTRLRALTLRDRRSILNRVVRLYEVSRELGPNHPIQWLPGAFYPWIKRSGEKNATFFHLVLRLIMKRTRYWRLHTPAWRGKYKFTFCF